MDRRYLVAFACIFMTWLCIASESEPAYLLQNRIDLGKALFNDTSLSADRHVACASCHRPDDAFSDSRERAMGVFGLVGSRNTPSLLNIGTSKVYFWDGRRDRLEDVVLDPFFMPLEMGLRDDGELVEHVTKAGYAQRFATAFPDSPAISLATIQASLTAYVRSLRPAATLYEQPPSTWNLHGPAERGMQLFFGKAQCSSCHAVGPGNGRFTDDRFHPSALGTQSLASSLPSLVSRYLAAPAEGRQLGAVVGSHRDVAELGHFLVDEAPGDINTFRTPSLLNVAITAPYMHDGSVATLDKAVDLEIYYRSLQSGKPLQLTTEERSELVAFLSSLRTPAPRR